MRPAIPNFQKGEHLTAAKLQSLLDEIRRLSRLSVTPPLELYWGATGPTIALKQWPNIVAIRRGILQNALPACSLSAGIMVHEHSGETNTDGTPKERKPLFNQDGTKVLFAVVEDHGTALHTGQFVTCVPWAGDYWVPIAAHCTGACSGTASGCQGASPACPPGTHAQCVNGQWQCVPDSPTDPCTGIICLDGSHPEPQPNGTCLCVPDGPGPDPCAGVVCPPGTVPLVLPNGTCVCAVAIPGDGGVGGGGAGTIGG